MPSVNPSESSKGSVGPLSSIIYPRSQVCSLAWFPLIFSIQRPGLSTQIPGSPLTTCFSEQTIMMPKNLVPHLE